jgi:hypothetical protein
MTEPTNKQLRQRIWIGAIVIVMLFSGAFIIAMLATVIE